MRYSGPTRYYDTRPALFRLLHNDTGSQSIDGQQCARAHVSSAHVRTCARACARRRGVTRTAAAQAAAEGNVQLIASALGNLAAGVVAHPLDAMYVFAEYFVPGLPHVILIEFEACALVSYQDYHMLF